MNYKITATFTDASNGETENVLFVVYVAPGQSPVLVSAVPLMM